MARKPSMKAGEYEIDFGRVNSMAQEKFFTSYTKYLAFGGARGGGKTWCSRTKAAQGVLQYPGIKILFVRRHYEDLEDSIIAPILDMFPEPLRVYNASKHFLTFWNGSTIKFGNMEGYSEAIGGKYQGQEYDWIFIEEATQFTEAEFRGLCACCRGVNNIPKRVFLTCNPGGIGHQWVKRIFVKRDFLPNENPEDYTFIKATVEDNVDLMETSPDYINALDLLPEDVRAAHRYGDWDALAGGYFPEFTVRTHVIDDFIPNPAWAKYRAFDYGLDMFACLWIACDFSGRYYVYREYCEKGLNVPQAARAALAVTPASERIEFTLAPTDIWSTQKVSGKTMAQAFAEYGMPLVKADRNRVQGWLALKELLMVREDGLPGLLVCKSCKGLIDDLMAIQHDDKNPSDCAVKPHEITHRPDALRYFAIMRTLPPESRDGYEEENDYPSHVSSYEDYMCGGEPGEGYMWH